jgi:thiaminase
MNDRLDPNWSFTTLYLVKDSFALMLESARLYSDAFNEYVELETCYLEALERAAVPSVDFGQLLCVSTRILHKYCA